MAPRITDEDVSWISNRIYELVALKEGLFPDSEAKIVLHQLTDLPDSIHSFGPILCWWAYTSVYIHWAYTCHECTHTGPTHVMSVQPLRLHMS